MVWLMVWVAAVGVAAVGTIVMETSIVAVGKADAETVCETVAKRLVGNGSLDAVGAIPVRAHAHSPSAVLSGQRLLSSQRPQFGVFVVRASSI